MKNFVLLKSGLASLIMIVVATQSNPAEILPRDVGRGAELEVLER